MCNAAAGARAPVDARDHVLGLLRHDFHRVLGDFREAERLRSPKTPARPASASCSAHSPN